MKKSELIELARKNGVIVYPIYWGWRIDVCNNNCEKLMTSKKLSTLIKFLADNNIKINN